jgi:hypothetical protein
MTGGGGGAQDLASIQKVVDELPELNRRKREVAKHVAICSDLSKKAAPLFSLSEVQQELLMMAVQPSMPLPEDLFRQGTFNMLFCSSIKQFIIYSYCLIIIVMKLLRLYRKKQFRQKTE